jgi:hypothetical protein
MFDAVNAAAIPADARYAAYYVDGSWPNEAAVRARVPHATLLSITTRGGNADCVDSEVGDLDVASTERWVAERLSAGHHRPCVYANLDRWENQGLRAALAKYGSNIRRWVADWDNRADVPSGFDAHQFSTGNVDTSVCLDNFFVAAPAPVKHPAGIANFEGSLHLKDGSWHVRGIPGTFRGAPPSEWWSAELQVNTESGHWRIRGLSKNAKPLGG